MGENVVDNFHYAVQGNRVLVQPDWGDAALVGCRQVTVEGIDTAETPWSIGAVDGLVGRHRLKAGRSGIPEAEGEYISVLDCSDSFSVAGKARLSGYGEAAAVLGFRSVQLQGRDGDHLLTVAGEVSTWRTSQSHEGSAYSCQEEIDITTTVATNWDGQTRLTTTVGKSRPAEANYTWKRNAIGASFTGEYCETGDIRGYKSVTLAHASTGAVVGGRREEAATSDKTFTERRETRDTYEFPYMPFYMLHTEEHVSKTTYRLAIKAEGAFKATSCTIGGNLTGYQTATLRATAVSGGITGGELRHERSEQENLRQSGYTLYVDSGHAAEAETVVKKSTGQITLSQDTTVTGTIAGYDQVRLDHASAADISWALPDDLLGTQNSTAVSSSKTTHQNDYAEVTQHTRSTIVNGGTLTIAYSDAGTVTGFSTVAIANSTVQRVAQDTLLSLDSTSSYGYGGFRPVYAPTPKRSIVPGFLGGYPVAKNAASGKATLKDTVVASGIDGYAEVKVTGGAIGGGLQAGKSSTKDGCYSFALAGKATLKDTSLAGDITGFAKVQLTNVISSDAGIECGAISYDFSGGGAPRLSGTVSLRQSSLDGTISHAARVTLVDSTVGGLTSWAAGTMAVTMKNSQFTGDLDGNASLSVSGECSIDGSLLGGYGKDTLTLQANARLDIGGDLDLGDGKNKLRLRQGSTLRIQGDLALGSNDGLALDGDLIVLGDATDLWEAGRPKGNGAAYVTSDSWDAAAAASWNSHFEKGVLDLTRHAYDIGDFEAAQHFQGAAAERGDNSPDGAVDLLSWMGAAEKKQGWLCGHENVYYIMDAGHAPTPAVYPPATPHIPLDNPRYFLDKEDWYSLDLEAACDAGVESIGFSPDVNVYVFGDRWFDILDRDCNSLDLGALCERHAGDTRVQVCVAVSGSTFVSPGTYTIALNRT